MIIDNFTQIKQYLPAITIKTDSTLLDDMLNTSEAELVEDVLGEDLYQLLLLKKEEDKPLNKTCERIIALSAFVRAIPDLDLVLTQSGFAVHSSDALVPASPARIKALTASLLSREDNETDRLIRYLLASEKYEDIWRNTNQFNKITAGLITNYQEFKEYAPYNPAVAAKYPPSYREFKKLYTNFSLALLTEVAPYLSEDYCQELIEKFRDREIFTMHEKYVLSLIRYALCSYALDDKNAGRMFVIKARAYMLKFPLYFNTFINSPEAQTLDNTDNNSPIFSML